MQYRSVEDKLREQYSHHLPAMRMVADQLESEVRYHLLPIGRKLAKHEQIFVRSRVKDCESALNKLRSREGNVFDESKPDTYSITSLKDLAAVRVMAFPNDRLAEIDAELRRHFPKWNSDPFKEDPQLGFKYVGHCSASQDILAEYQVVPMLIGLFWKVEHAAIYKQADGVKGMKILMKDSTDRVLSALKQFEADFMEHSRQTEDSN